MQAGPMRKRPAANRESEAHELVPKYKRPAMSLRYGAFECLDTNRSSFEIQCTPSTQGATTSRKRGSTPPRGKPGEKAQRREQKTKLEAHACEHVSREPSVTRASSDPSASSSGAFELSQGADTTASKLENLYLIANRTAPTQEQSILLSAKGHKCRPRQNTRKKTEEQRDINTAATLLQKRTTAKTLTPDTQAYLEALDQVSPKKRAGRKRWMTKLYNEAMNGATEEDVELLRKLKALGHYPHDSATTPPNERAMASQARRRQKSNKSSDVNIKAYLVALQRQTTKNRSSSQADALIREVQTFIQAHSRMPVERPTTAGKRRTGGEPSVEAQDGEEPQEEVDDDQLEERGESSTADVRATYENKLARRWHRGVKKTGFLTAEHLDMLVELDPC